MLEVRKKKKIRSDVVRGEKEGNVCRGSNCQQVCYKPAV